MGLRSMRMMLSSTSHHNMEKQQVVAIYGTCHHQLFIQKIDYCLSLANCSRSSAHVVHRYRNWNARNHFHLKPYGCCCGDRSYYNLGSYLQRKNYCRFFAVQNEFLDTELPFVSTTISFHKLFLSRDELSSNHLQAK